MNDSQERGDEDQEQQQPGFRKVDKRHSASQQSEETQPADSAGDEPVAEQAEATAEATGLSEMDVYDTLRFTVGMLAQQAWIMMGMRLSPGAEELTKDLPQAKVAIDTLEFVISKLKPQLDEKEQTEIDSLLTDLRVNYVKKA